MMGGSFEPPFLLPQKDSTQAKQPARARCRPALHTKSPEGTTHQQRRSERTRQHEGDKPQQHRRPPCQTQHEASDCSPPKTSWQQLEQSPKATARTETSPVRPQYGGNVQYHTISNWLSHGRADVEAGQPSTAYARFTKRYQDLIAEHCGPDNNRNRGFDRALEILERTCECSNDKVLLPDGKLGNTCQECQDLDAAQRRRARRT